MDSEFCVVITTFNEKEVGQRIIDRLIGDRLAACVQTMPIESFYHWNGAVNREAETLVLVKTKTELYPQVQACIKANHSYEVPEIIQVPITTGLPAYLEWITSVCR